MRQAGYKTKRKEVKRECEKARTKLQNRDGHTLRAAFQAPEQFVQF
jgi:hypothetical protein